MTNVLVVAAHPDDEVLGAGGVLCMHQARRDSLSICFLSAGEGSRGGGVDDAPKRHAQGKTVGERLGATVFWEDFPDNAFDSVPLLRIAKTVEKAVEASKPEIVYTHFAHDLNVDHRLTHQAVLTACRPQPGKTVKKILSFEVRSSTEWQQPVQFAPNYYVDIGSYIEKKKELLSVYTDELRDYPHPRSTKGVEVLAQYRGTEVGFEYAEAFQTVRILDNG